MQAAIGIDLGGSSAKIGIVADTGAVLAHDAVSIPASATAPQLLELIAVTIERLRDHQMSRNLPIAAVGCGVSGNLDLEHSSVLLNNIPILDGFALRPWLAQRFDLPIVLDNDACMAAFAEAQTAEEPDQRTLVVTVGSGIGVVLVVGTSIVRLAHGATGEAGHLIVALDSDETCPLGCLGCLETVASARAIERAANQAASSGASPALVSARDSNGFIAGASVAAAAAAGDPAARDILRQAGRWLGIGMASWAAIYAPTHIILGGGVAYAGDQWLETAIETLRRRGVPAYTRHIQVRTGRYGAQAGVIGAALMAVDLVHQHSH